MARHFVTLGQDHVHVVNGIYLDKDCVVSYEAENQQEGRDKAFALFGPKFCFEYHDKQFNMDDLHFFPRGIINID